MARAEQIFSKFLLVLSKRKKKMTFFSFFFGLFSIFYVSSEIITDKDFGFSLDIPEGYLIEEQSQDGMSILFSHPNISTTFIIKITDENATFKENGTFKEKSLQQNDSLSTFSASSTSSTPSKLPSDVLKTSLNKLSAKFDIDSFIWSKRTCSISSFRMTLDKDYEGWSVCVPLNFKNIFLTLLCYAPKVEKSGCEQFIISTLNSLSLDSDTELSQKETGIFTAYAFPKEGDFPISVEIGGKKINTKLDESDFDASQFVVDLEYSVLKFYANHKMWKEAWQRYYRMIYRDSAARLSKASSDIYKAIFQTAKSKNPENPEIAFAQFLLSWVQNFEYQREQTKNSSDFTPLPLVLKGKGNDCDSRSMIVSVILNSCGIDTIMLISREYSHAMVATEISAPGQTYHLKENNKEYLLGETTAKVTWGMIAQNQSDRSKWIPVIFEN